MASATIPPVLTSPRDDTINLHRTLKGLGCDTSAIINILAHRDATQQAYLQQKHKIIYHEDLTKCLSSKLSSNTKKDILL
ncbi:hypothetical protein ACFX1Q_034428 [Malus domestica]